jgi:multidrug transporter EmrE-like cation transporter
MTMGLMVLGFLTYCIQAWISYNPTLKASLWYFPLGLVISNITALSWMYLAKHIQDPNQVYSTGMIWDGLIVVSFYLVPLAFFSVKMNPISFLGIGLVLIGTVLVKCYS